jgi:hypothetical protein
MDTFKHAAVGLHNLQSTLSQRTAPLQEELSRYPDLEYCKVDLIASKGVVFVKYAKASSALQALEEVAGKGMVSSSCCCD